MSYRVLVALLAAALLAAGCGSKPSAGSGEGEMRGKAFTSTAVTDQGKPRALVGGTKVELRFTDDGRLLATAGCNQMQGPVTLAGGKLTVTDLSTTDMACPTPGLHEQDEWLAKFLTATPSWRLDGTNLVITGSDTEIVLAAEAPTTLEGGLWVVDGLITKDAVSSVPGGVKATFSFKDGHIYVQAGCNGGSTDHTGGQKYEVDGQAIESGDFVFTAMLCGPDQMAVESAVMKVLEQQRFDYKIDGNTLTLTNASGAGLKLKK
jgi:heat shock protein HslJ